MTEISVVVPILNEEGNIRPLYAGLREVLGGLGKTYEIIFVDDGSSDGSFDILKELAAADSRLKIVKFTKNFGQTPAIAAGIGQAQGEIIVLMDGDLQNDPRDIPCLLDKMKPGTDVVSGWRRKRQDPLSKKIPSYVANRLIAFLTGIKLHDFGCTLKAYRKEAIKGINLYGEMHRFLPVLASRAGYSITEVEISHSRRSWGKSKYGLSRFFRVILDLPTLVFLQNPSLRPNYIFGGCGLALIFVSFLVFGWTIFCHIQKGILLSGIIFVIGIQLFFMGLLLEMMIRESQRSPAKDLYIIKTIIGQ